MIIYTCLTNDYVSLPTQMPSGAEYYVFGVDNPPAPWKSLPNPTYIKDPVRLSRYHKIYCPFDESVYVDASKLHLLNDSFIEMSEEILNQNDFFIMRHPCKFTWLEECAEYVSKGWVDEDTLLDFTENVKSAGYEFNHHFSPLCTILWRRNQWHFNDKWWEWYNKGGIRDQLSFSVALQLTKVKYNWEHSRDLLNKFTNAEPDGIWWKNKSGDYKYCEKKDPDEFVNRLSEITGLNKMFRYRAAIFTKTGDLVLGDRGKYWPKNYHSLKILSGRVNH